MVYNIDKETFQEARLMNEFGEYLRELRGEKSLREMERITGLSHTYLSTLEKGVDPRSGKERKPTPEALKQISDAFPDVSYMDLLRKAGYIKTPDTFGDTIRELREKKGWSLDNLEEETIFKNDNGDIVDFISKGRLIELESGNIKNPSKDEILLLCRAFNVPFHQLTTPDIEVEVSLEDKIKFTAADMSFLFEASNSVRQKLLNKATDNGISNEEKVEIYDYIQNLDSFRYLLADKAKKFRDTLQNTGLIEPPETDTNKKRKNEDENTQNTEYLLRENEIGNLLLFNANINYKGQPLSTYQRRLLFEKVIEVMEQPKK